MKQYLFFDLDGTLVNSADGILNSVEYAVQKLGLPERPREQLLHFIGPPLVQTFSADYGMERAEALRAVDAYREYYQECGIFECRLYAGVPEMLAHLQAAGYGLVLATCKPTVSAVRVLEHFGLAERFAVISGPELDGTRNEKHEVIAYARAQLGGLEPADALMIGDRRDDVLGAMKNGMVCAGALWGFGSRQELIDAGAAYLLTSPQEAAERLPAILRGSPDTFLEKN